MAALFNRRETPGSWTQDKLRRGLLALGMENYGANRLAHRITSPLLALSPLGAAEDAVNTSRDYGATLQRGERVPVFGGLGVGMAALGAIPGARPASKAAREGGELAMDTASRMARAKQMGFDVDTPLYHGTASDFEEFLPSQFGKVTNARSARAGAWVVDQPEVASGYARYASRPGKVAALTAQADAAGARNNWAEYDRLTALAEQVDSLPPSGANVIPLMARGKIHSVDMKNAEFMDVQDIIHREIAAAKAKGFDGVQFQNLADDIERDGNPARHTVIFDPKNLRSRFAAFDPAKRNSANLMAGVGGAGVLGGGIMASEQEKTQQGRVY